MNTSTRDDIYRSIKNSKQSSVKNLMDEFGISAQMIHRHLNKLVSEKKISKNGKPPKVLYTLNKQFNPVKSKTGNQTAYGEGLYESKKQKKKISMFPWIYGEGEYDKKQNTVKKAEKTPTKNKINIIMDKLWSNKKGLDGIVRVKK